MNKNDIDSYPSSSTEDNEIPLKRQKLKTTNSSPLDFSITGLEIHNDSTMSSLEEELTALHMKLSQTTAIASQFRQKINSISEVLEGEATKLEIEVEVEKEMIKHVEVRLATKIRTSQHNHTSQATLEPTESKLKTRINEKVTNLLRKTAMIHLSTQDTLPSPKTQESETVIERKLKAADDRVMLELKGMLDDNEKLKEARMKMQKFKSGIRGDEGVMMMMVQENGSGERPMSQVASNIISRFQKSQAVFRQKTEKLNSRVADLRKQHKTVLQIWEELNVMVDMRKNDVKQPKSEVIEKGFHPEANDDEDPSEKVLINADKFPSGSSNVETNAANDDPPAEVPEDLDIQVSDYCVRVSDRRFFEIDWAAHYTQDVSCEFFCNKCSLMKNTRALILDHIWVTHFGGHFKCPPCPDSGRALTRRYSIGQHMRSKHPDAFRLRK